MLCREWDPKLQILSFTPGHILCDTRPLTLDLGSAPSPKRESLGKGGEWSHMGWRELWVQPPARGFCVFSDTSYLGLLICFLEFVHSKPGLWSRGMGKA